MRESRGEIELQDVDALCGITEPLHASADKTEALMRACRAMACYHQAHCRELRHVYEKNGFDPESLLGEDDLERLPALNVAVFKRYALSARDPDTTAIPMASSGTSGRPTRIWLDEKTYWRSRQTRRQSASQLGIAGREPVNYLICAHRPRPAEDILLAMAFTGFTDWAPAAGIFYAVQPDSAGGWSLQTDPAIAQLRTYADAGLPVRIMGPPAFVYDLALALASQGCPALPPRSWVFTCGGWKTREARSVAPQAFREKLAGIFGLPAENVRDFFGMAEHGILYMQCPRHRFHIPAYSRILVRDPVTLKVLAPGQAGLMELITPLDSLMPTLAVLSMDLGFIDPAACGCGLRSPTFTLLGRGGISFYRTCALRMEDMAGRRSN